METKDKEVLFNLWCDTCVYAETPEVKDPCNECLSYPSNEHSHKPRNYVERD